MLDEHSLLGAISGASERQLDALTAVRAAVQVTGPDRTAQSIEPFLNEFFRWLRNSSYDDTDRALRRYLLLTITADTRATPEREEALRLVKLAESLRADVGT
ncbi:MAG: hypothetical protein GEV09_11010 [Pseudonocardiaceae bacterium]|nr:hypothetical protein [Pseudonocardiaceae bacterium]